MRSRRAFAVIAVACLFVMASVLGYTHLVISDADPDMFWHVKTGQYILSSGQIPRTDVFSWVGPLLSLKWMPHEWLFDVLLAAVYSGLGFAGVYVGTSLLLGVLSVLVFAFAYQRTRHFALSLVIGALSIPAAMPSVYARPQMATFVLLVAIALLLERDRWYFALPLMLLGVNLHGGVYPVYLVLFAYYTIPRRAWVFVGACAAVLVQPFGVGLLRYPFFAFDSQVRGFVEAQPTALVREPLFLAAILLLVAAVDWREVPWKDALFAVAFGVLGLVAVRNIPYFFILVVPVLAPHIRGLRAGEASTDWDGGYPPRRLRSLILAPLLLVTLLYGLRLPALDLNVDRHYPKAAVTWIREHKVEHVWNNWGDGGYLIFHGVPSLIDGRADPFTPFFDPKVTLARDYIASYYIETDIRGLLDRYAIKHLLVGKDLPLFRVLEQSRDFAVDYEDAEYVVFRYVGDRSAAVK